MARMQTQGKCALCQKTFGKAAMSRHLAKCLAQHETAGSAVSKAKPKKNAKLYHLVVQGRYNPQYWLHLDVPATATLYDLDDFLRHIWLECCGHMSQFKIGGAFYSVQPVEDAFAMSWGDDFEERDMNVQVGKVFRPGMTFTYEYDFGSTTELAFKVVAEREGQARKQDDIRVLARNDPPAIPCAGCGAPATQVATEAAWEREGWLCDACAEKSAFDQDMFLPVVNSPRVGVCAYTGPA